MKNYFKNKQSGRMSLFGFIVLGIVLILLLSYFKVTVRGIIESPEGQDNVNYVQSIGQNIWQNYLQDPATYLWNDVWVPLIWHPVLSLLVHVKDKIPAPSPQ